MYKSEWALENLLLKKNVVTKINELQKYYRRAMINNTFILRVCKIPSKLVYTIVRRQTKDLTTADVQRVHHHDAVLIKENESDQRERVTTILKIRESSLCKEI